MKKTVFFSTFLLLLTLGLPLNAQTVDILWQGETYTPPFYQGRSLWSTQSQVTLMAVPQGLGNPSELRYKWIRNNTVLGDLSGIGRNNMSFSDTIFSKPVAVKVQIVSDEGEILAENTTSITPIIPALYVYENNPLYGFIFHREVSGGYRLEDSEVTFTAFPLFVKTPSRISYSLKYKWSTNGGGVENSNSVTYRVPEEGSGTSQVNLSLTDESTLTQPEDKNFLIRFGNENE